MRHLRQTLIFAVAQRAFDSNSNSFSTLRPLATLNGEEVAPQDFPNRGLAWWMVRGMPEITRSRPGRLLTAEVEEAIAPNSSDPEKDLLQVNFDSVQVAGPKRLIEVVSPEGHMFMKPQTILNGAVAYLDHEPTTLVLVRVGQNLYGPLRAETDDDHGQHDRYAVRFAKGSVVRSIYEVDQKTLPVMHLSAEVALDSKSPIRSELLHQCSYEIALWSAFETACATAKAIRLNSVEESIGRVAKVVISKSKRQDLMRQFKELTSAGASVEVDPDDLATVEDLALGLNRSVEAVDGLVAAIVEGGFLAEEVSRAVDAAAAKAVAERASSIRADAEQQLKEVRQTLEDRRKELATIDADLERKHRAVVADVDLQLAAKRKAVDLDIGQRLESIGKEKAELDRQRNTIEQNLASVVKSFREEKDKLIANFLAISPILESAGIIRGEAPADEGRRPADVTLPPVPPITLPPALSLERAGAAMLNEEQFFERFRRHVEDCGFSYRTIDLVSFHLSVKCSDLSVVGGVSGTGKSSLPKLYAQAMAGDDDSQTLRFLPVDVSPAWTNPSDTLGYVNLLDRSFHPGGSGLFTHLAWAAMEEEAKGKDSGLYLVCLVSVVRYFETDGRLT